MTIYDQIPKDIQKMHDLGFKGEGYTFVAFEANADYPHDIWVRDILQAHVPLAKGHIEKTTFDTKTGMINCLKHNPDVINMSFEGGNPDYWRNYLSLDGVSHTALFDSFFNSTFIVAASCNKGDNKDRFPAATEYYKDQCLSAGSAIWDGRHWLKDGYVTYNNKLDVLTKGDYIINGEVIKGTSFSAPGASGRAVLYMEQLDKLGWTRTIATVRNCLIGKTIDIYDNGYDIKSGYGILEMGVCMVHTVEFTVGEAKYFVDGEKRINKGLQTIEGNLVEVEVPVTVIDGRTQLSIDVTKKLCNEFAPVIEVDTVWNVNNPNKVIFKYLSVK